MEFAWFSLGLEVLNWKFEFAEIRRNKAFSNFRNLILRKVKTSKIGIPKPWNSTNLKVWNSCFENRTDVLKFEDQKLDFERLKIWNKKKLFRNRKFQLKKMFSNFAFRNSLIFIILAFSSFSIGTLKINSSPIVADFSKFCFHQKSHQNKRPTTSFHYNQPNLRNQAFQQPKWVMKFNLNAIH